MPLNGSHPPRIRPYHVGDTTKTLFGYTRSARVFDTSLTSANVLVIRMWDDAEAMQIEEEDAKLREQDFKAFLRTLREAKCWIWIDGEWTRSCNVEAKAML
jgi:hypothetical protein